MNTKDRISQLRGYQIAGEYSANEARAAIKALQLSCEHVWQLHSLYAKPCGDNGIPPKWWVHLACPLCDHSSSDLYDAPVCRVCLQPMMHAENSPEASRMRTLAKRLDTDAGRVFVFKCEPCKFFEAIPTRIENKKK